MSACVNAKAIHSKNINNNLNDVMNNDSLRLKVNQQPNVNVSMHSSYNYRGDDNWSTYFEMV